MTAKLGLVILESHTFQIIKGRSAQILKQENGIRIFKKPSIAAELGTRNCRQEKVKPHNGGRIA